MISLSPPATAGVPNRHFGVEVASGRSRPPIPTAPLLSSAGGPWSGFVLEHRRSGEGFEVRRAFSPDHLVATAVERSCRFEWQADGRFQEMRLRPGEVIFVPASIPFSCRSAEPGDLLGMTLTPTFLRCAAHEFFARTAALELMPQMPVEDPFLSGALLALRSEIRAGYPGGPSYGEALATAIAAHLVRHFAHLSPVTHAVAGSGLTRHQLRQAIEYIQEHLAEEIPLGVLATVAGLSPFHFCRIFKQSIGLSPHRYLVQQRVERARELILSGQRRISDVAVSVGFCDQSHLTAHFKRTYGVTPREFRYRATPSRKA